MSIEFRNYISDVPVSLEGCEIVEPKSKAFDEYVQSPTFEYAVKVDGWTLGEIEELESKRSIYLQDGHRRDKSEQVEQRVQGTVAEVAFSYLAKEIGVPVEWLSDGGEGDDGCYCGDALLLDDSNNEDYVIEIKSAQMSSKGQNIPIRGSYEGDDTPEDALRKSGEIPDLVVFAYTYYTASSYIVGFEGVEPVSEELNGLLYREPRELYDGELYLYDRKCVRHRVEDLDGLLLDKLRSLD